MACPHATGGSSKRRAQWLKRPQQATCSRQHSRSFPQDRFCRPPAVPSYCADPRTPRA